VGYNNIKRCTMVCSGVLGCFPLGNLLTETLDISLSLVHQGSMSGWTSLMERYMPQRFIFEWDITRARTKSRTPVRSLSDITLSPWSYHLG